MTTVKRTIVATLTVFCSLLLAAIGAYQLVDDATLVGLLVKGLETASDTRISYGEDAAVTRTLAPTLRVNELVIDDTEDRYRVETRSLQLQISLSKLLVGRLDVPRLWLGDTRVHVAAGTTTSKATVHTEKTALPDLSMLRLKPVLHDAQVAELSILLEGEGPRLPASRIRELSLELEPGAEIPALSARVELEGETLDISATLPNLHEAVERQQLPFSVSVTGEIAEWSAVGQVDFNRSSPVVQATLRARFPDLNKLPGEKGFDIPGELTAKAQLNGSFDQLSLEDLSADWAGPGQSVIKLNGRVGHVTGVEGIELYLTGQLDEAAWLSPLLPDSIAPLETAQVAAQVSGTRSQLQIREFNLKARVSDELDLSLVGQFDLANVLSEPEHENINVELDFSAPTTRAARALLFDTVPEFGEIEGRTVIRSTSGVPAFENIVIRAKDENGIQVDLSGRIAHFPLNPNEPNKGYDLDVTMKATRASVMVERAGLDLPLNGRVDLKYRIEGDTQALRLNQIKLSARDDSGTLINAKGRILFREWDREDPLEAIDLALDLRARNTGLLSEWLKQDFPPLAYSVHARLHTASGQHRIDDFRLETEPGEPLVVSQTGSAKRITFLPEFGIAGIQLSSSLRTADVATLNELLKLDNAIPSIGPLEWRAKVTGSDQRLLIDDVLLTAGRATVARLEAKGRLGQFGAATKWRLEDTGLTVSAQSSSSQAFGKALGYDLPPLGALRMYASINGKGKTLRADSIDIRVGDSANPVLQSRGVVGDLYAASKIRVVTEVNLALDRFVRFTDEQGRRDLGALNGKMVISDNDGSLGIDSLNIESTPKVPFSLYVEGRFDDFSRPETLVVNTRLTASNMTQLGALLEHDWPDHGPVELNGQVKQADGNTELEAIMISGQETIHIGLSGDFQSSPPQVKGTITAQNFYLPDLAEIQRSKRAARYREDEKPSGNRQVFSRTPVDLNWAESVDLELFVDIESFDRMHSEAESAQLPITLKSGRLLIDHATIVYPKGEAVLDLQLDTQEPVEVNVSLVGENLDPWRGLSIYEPNSNYAYKPENAELDVDVSLSSSGNSPHELAANLRGHVYLAGRHGKISQSEMRLLFVDIIGWVADLKEQRYTDLHCAVADYSIRQGVIATNAFFVDTRNITIAGEGNIDLGKEQIDYVFIPKKKSRLILNAEPVKIKGPLGDPSIKAIPAKSLTLTVGTFSTLLFAPYVFAAIVAGDFAGDALRAKSEDSSACLKYLETRGKPHKSSHSVPLSHIPSPVAEEGRGGALNDLGD